MKGRRAFAFVLGALASAAAHAQDTGAGQPEPSGNQPSSVQRVEIAARQSATDLRRAASVAKQIYGRDELDRYGDTNALDVLRRLPGVNVAGDGPRMRGLGAGYTQILINGDRAPPGFALDQLSPSQIERIEVLRAPTADQSAQAIAGTINIILKDAPRRSQRDLRLGLSSGLGRPQGNVNVTWGESKGGWSVSLPVSAFEWRRENINTTERLGPSADSALPAAAEQVGRQEVWGHGYNAGPRVNWKISDDQDVALQTFFQKGYWNNSTRQETRVFSGTPVLDDDSRQNGTWLNHSGNLTWKYRFKDDQRIELRAGVRENGWSFDVKNHRQGTETLRTVGGGRQLSYTQAGKYSLLMGEAHSLTAGWDLEHSRRNEYRTVTDQGVLLQPEFEGQPFNAQVQRLAFFAQDEWEISPQWQMYLGLRYESIKTRSRNSDTPTQNSSEVLSPLLHLTWKLDPKGRDMVRASLTRSYKAPNPGTLLARPSINSNYTDTRLANTALQPDRIGNPALRPELATGLDVAFEKYLAGGGLWSVGLFHRQITDLVRTTTTLQPESVGRAPRYVAQPVNFSKATTSGVELEVKGRAAELLPQLLGHAKALNLRASLNFYRSSVAALPGPDNRLDGQQPWTATLGFDQRLTGVPLNVGGSLGLNPRYTTRVALDQQQERSRTTTVDLYGQWTFKPGLSLRLAASAGVQPFGPPNGSTRTVQANGEYSNIDRYTRPNLNATLDVRL